MFVDPRVFRDAAPEEKTGTKGFNSVTDLTQNLEENTRLTTDVGGSEVMVTLFLESYGQNHRYLDQKTPEAQTFSKHVCSLKGPKKDVFILKTLVLFLEKSCACCAKIPKKKETTSLNPKQPVF